MHRRLLAIAFVAVALIAIGVAQAAPDCSLSACVYVPVSSIERTPTPTLTATNPPKGTGTPTTPTPTATSTPVVLLPNGDFEQGAVFWQPQESADTVIIANPSSPITPHSGVYIARLTASQISTESAIDAVNVVVPIGKSYLSYWIWIRSTEPTCGDDLGGVGVGTNAVDTFALCAATQTSGWVNRVVNLTSYTGQTVTIELLAGTFDADAPDSFLFVDDVGWRATA